jgi:hypothetical protein
MLNLIIESPFSTYPLARQLGIQNARETILMHGLGFVARRAFSEELVDVKRNLFPTLHAAIMIDRMAPH